MPLDEIADRRPIDERRIARHDDDGVDRRERRQPSEHRAGGAIGILLHGPTTAGPAAAISASSVPPGETTTTTCSAPASCAAAIGQPTSGRPASSCSTLGVRERMRVPRPAARTRTAKLTHPGYRGAAPGPLPVPAGTRALRTMDSNHDLTAPKAAVLPLHQSAAGVCRADGTIDEAAGRPQLAGEGAGSTGGGASSGSTAAGSLARGATAAGGSGAGSGSGTGSGSGAATGGSASTGSAVSSASDPASDPARAWPPAAARRSSARAT